MPRCASATKFCNVSSNCSRPRPVLRMPAPMHLPGSNTCCQHGKPPVRLQNFINATSSASARYATTSRYHHRWMLIQAGQQGSPSSGCKPLLTGCCATPRAARANSSRHQLSLVNASCPSLTRAEYPATPAAVPAPPTPVFGFSVLATTRRNNCCQTGRDFSSNKAGSADYAAFI